VWLAAVVSRELRRASRPAAVAVERELALLLQGRRRWVQI
jgi:hypothetical protein